MKNILFTLAILINYSVNGQDSFIISDSTNFDISERSDTLSLHFTEYPSSLPIDIDKDGENDITIRVHREQPAPQNDFTPIDHIYLDNHIGMELDVLSSNNHINFYQESDIAEVKNDTIWKSKETFLLYYEASSSGWWEGIGWPGPTTINDVYMALKLNKNNGILYSWLKFSGTGNFPELYLHEVAVSKEKITSEAKEIENQLDINIFPNPTSEIVQIDLKDIKDRNLEWTIYDMSMQQINTGYLTNKITTVDLVQLNLPKGLYILQVRQHGILLNIHHLIKI